MKKLFALLALAALLLTVFAFPVLAEEPILGGWSAYTDNPTEIPTEALDALNAALDGLEGLRLQADCAAGHADCRGHKLLLSV